MIYSNVTEALDAAAMGLLLSDANDASMGEVLDAVSLSEADLLALVKSVKATADPEAKGFWGAFGDNEEIWLSQLRGEEGADDSAVLQEAK
ncbi:hypothetical protein TeGR_g8058 [Tetraparma gracilis]|uniref:Uncharacterized protein n=1 Tax=Tetraparma gracilis TaxID=2962635 RepID=A0ABQ6MWB3_9STRA|nr:hypothetical protein TeGR_g8058 [Tetraparma gracilis]